MKCLIKLIVLFPIVFAGCKSWNGNSETVITGTYVRQINDEFAKGSDSLIVTSIDQQGATYSVINEYGFTRYLDGQEKGKGHTTKKFVTQYDRDKQQLVDQFKGVVFTLIPEKGIILMGSAEYYKR